MTVMTSTSAPANKTGTRAGKRSHQAASTKAAKGSKAAAPASTPTAVDVTGRDVLVPLDRLFISEANVRKVHYDDGIAELAALIDAQGLLQRLCVVAHPDGRCGVVAGGRRLRAMQLLVSTVKWTASQPVSASAILTS